MAGRTPDVASLHPGIAIEITSDFTSSAAFPPVIPPQNQPMNRPRASDEWIRGPLDRCQASMRWCSTAAFATRPASSSRVSPPARAPCRPARLRNQAQRFSFHLPPRLATRCVCSPAAAHDWTDRVALITEALQVLRVKLVTIDGEGVVCRPNGVSDFAPLRAAVLRRRRRDVTLSVPRWRCYRK